MKHIVFMLLLALLTSAAAFAREHRSWHAKHLFELQTGYPYGRAGYVVDHVIPLACNGPDDPSNMQWETIDQAKEKDTWERRECRIIDGRPEGCCETR